MVRLGFAIAVLSVVTQPAFAQELDAARNDTVRAMIHRSGSERPADHLADRLDDIDALLAAHFVGRLAATLVPQAIVADHILDRLADDRYEKALADYLHLLREEEPTLVDPTVREVAATVGMSSRDSREIAFDRIARLPPSVLERYRRRIDVDAARLLNEGRITRDPEPLQQLVRTYRVARQADEAVALLGDLAFERGDFDQALAWWRVLAPLPSRVLAERRAGGRAKSGIDLPRLHAKEVLALLFARRPEAGRELDAVQALHPEARGQLAGRTDTYHAILVHWRDALARDLRGRDTARDREAVESWSTFAGEPDRNRVLLAAPSDRLWLDGSTWKKPLPALALKAPPPVWLSATRSLAIPPTPFHPVIADGQVLVSDGQSVHSFDLFTGAARFRAPEPALPTGATTPPTALGLTALGGRVYACLGDRPGDALAKSLVCLDLAEKLADKDRVVWKAAASTLEDKAVFDTDPLVFGDRVFAGAERPGDKSRRLLASYALDGSLLWHTRLADIKDADEPRPGRRALLVAAGPAIVYASNAGIVVAVDRWTGRRLWAFRYPSIDTGVSPRGPSTCLAADGRVFVAPADSDRLFCLDAATGRELWDQLWIAIPTDVVPGPRNVSQIVDLLGVSDDRLVFTDRYRLQAVDATTGTLAWQQPATGRLPGQGRGLLAGPWVFWPTADPDVSWRAVAHATGGLRDAEAVPEFYDPTTLRDLPAGNIALGEGCLVVAGATELTVYVPAGRQLPELERAPPQAKRDPQTLYRLALAQLATDQKAAAAQTLAALEASVPASEGTAWRSLVAARTTSSVSARASPVVLRRASAPAAEQRVERVDKLVPLWGPRPGVAPPRAIGPNGVVRDVALILDGDDVIAADAATGKDIVRRPRRDRSTQWIGQDGNIVVLAGTAGVEAYDLLRPDAAWWTPAPAELRHEPVWRLQDRTPKNSLPRPEAAHARFEQHWVLVENGWRAAALDPTTGAVVRRAGFDDVQPLTGERLAPYVDGELGNEPRLVSRTVLEPLGHGDAARHRAVLEPGVRLVGEPGGRVLLIGDGRVRWTYQHPWRTSLTGGPPQVFGAPGVCFAIVPCNQGDELVRLNPATGSPLWSLPAFTFREGLDGAAARVGPDMVYLVVKAEVQARRLADGSLAWKCPLPARPEEWALERFQGDLIAYPRTFAGLPLFSGPTDPFTAAATLGLGRRGLGFVPILLIDRDSGKVRSRIDVPHDRGPFFVNVQGPRLIVSAGGVVQAWGGGS